MENPFIWGQGGRKLTPDQVEQERALVAAARGRMGDTSPVGHWTQGAARVVDALGGVLRDKRTDKAEEAGMQSADDFISGNSVLSSLIGGNAQSVSTRASVPTAAPVTEGATTDLGAGIIATANAIGADPLDLATAISYETAGTFNPTQAGPTTQWGQHRGLIQFGEPQALEYGADFSSPEAALSSQLGENGAIANYFRRNGYQPGMSGLDLYSTINAGAPGRYTASDANNGGARGDVADKWNNQMADHRAKAEALLAGRYSAQNARTVQPVAPQQDNSVIAALAAGMSDPWVAKKYGPVIQALMGNQMQRGNMEYQAQLSQQDPAYQLGLERSQLELDQMRNPAAPAPIEVGGVLLDPTTYQPIFDSRTPSGDSGFTLSEGQQRFDAQGNPIASVAAPDPARPMTPQERTEWGIPADDVSPYAMIDGKPTKVGGGGVTVNNNAGGGEFDDAFAKSDAALLGTVSESGLSAQRNLGRIDQLEGLLSQSPTGAAGAMKLAAGEWGINTDGLSDIQAAQALINSLVPEQRQPGSGPMSDADLALFKQSLPRIINQPNGNQTIIATMRAIAEYDAQGATIVQRLRAGAIDRATAFSELQSRANPLSGFKAPSAVSEADFSSDEPMQGLSADDAELWKYATPDERRAMWGSN